MKRLWKILGILVATAILLNIVTEILNRKSLIGGIGFALHTPLVFLLNSLLFLTPFLLVFFTRRKVFLAVVLVVTGLTMAIANSVLLVFRTTPFTAADLRLVKYAATLLTTYLTWWQIVLMAVAAVAAIILCSALEKSAGGPAEGESDGIGLCIGGFHAGDLGGFKFLHCDRRSGASFWKYRTGL